MKTILRSVLVAFGICGGVYSASAQTAEQREYIIRNSDLNKVNELAAKFDTKFQVNYQKALELARENGWPLTKNNPDGSFSELKGVSEDGTPLYNRTSNVGSAITSRVNKINTGGGAGLELDGQEMLVGVWDGGRVLTNHTDLLNDLGKSRITKWDNTTNATAEHSTHVMGTILSKGVYNAASRGMAPKASGIYADWTNDKTEMASAVSGKNLLVSNHSYGLDASGITSVNTFGAYIDDSMDVDKLLFASPFYQPVWAAGNDRDSYGKYNPTKKGFDLLTGESTAKNVLVVAAVKEVLSYTNASSVQMSTFSNWGPTDDNRIKPDISNKGVDVFSTSIGDTSADVTTYAVLSGTSMAAPGVAGALILLQQHYGKLYPGTVMRSATLRGLVIHTADEAGDADGPDPKFGWGLINAERAAKTLSDAVAAQPKSIVTELTLSQGGKYERQVHATGTEPLVVTISWTDKEGISNTSAPQLVNDLYVRVVKDGVEVGLPWKLATSNTAAALRGENTVDNIEKIEMPGVAEGLYTVTVGHRNTLVGKDASHQGAAATQDYSLIVTGINEATLGFEKSDFKEFSVWPNPASDLLNVSFQTDLSSDAYVTLYDVQGRRVVDQKLKNSNDMMEGSFDISSLASGIYVVKVSQGDKQSVRKIVKK